MGNDYPSDAQKKDSISRRDFLKLLAAAGTITAFLPFIDWGKFMPNVRNDEAPKQNVMLKDGTPVNVRTFPVNYSQVIVYPRSEDRILNLDAIRTWELIRLPADQGGEEQAASAFRVYSRICLHLWCLWHFSPKGKDEDTGEMEGGVGFCPCHGSMYDVLTGVAIAGPASYQSPPANALPRLDLEVDENGFLWILPSKWDLHANGIIGYGRYIESSAS